LQAGGISPSRAGLAQSVLVVMVDLLGGVREPDGGLLGGLLIVLIAIPNGFTPRLLVDHRDGFHSGGDVSAKRANLESAPHDRLAEWIRLRRK
jgi:hypothetical protein